MKTTIQSYLFDLNKHLIFNDAFHTYHYNNLKLNNVTTFISKFCPPFDAHELALKLSQSKNTRFYGCSVEEILLDWKLKGEEALTLGRDVHNLAEGIINNNLTNFNPERLGVNDVKEYKDIIESFIKKHASEVVGAEIRVFSSYLKLAGTIDLMTYNPDGSVSLWDWKTGEKGLDAHNPYNKFLLSPISNVPDTKYGKYSLQLNLYKKILSTHDIEVKEMNIIKFEDKSYKIYPALDLNKEVELMLRHDKT